MSNERKLEKIIVQKLTKEFRPDLLELVDQTNYHKKHPGFKSGKSHFKLRIRSKKLSDLTRLNAHQAIYYCLRELMKTDIHALSIAIC